jgi:hypothetical protein
MQVNYESITNGHRVYVFRYSHVALIDLDEFIIPRHNDTISELIE